MKKNLGAILLASISTLGEAGPIVYGDFSDLSGWQLNGTASVLNPNSGHVLRLTDDLNQAGSAFLTQTVSLTNQASFSAAFEFQIGDPQGISDPDGQGADGLVFVVQTESNRAGSRGEGIGYQGLGRSVGVEFDTWYNPHLDEDGNHVGINLDGVATSLVGRSVETRMNNGEIWHAWVDYDGISDVLEVRLTDGTSRPDHAFLGLNVDLESVLETSDAYIGFTSGTGAAGGDHDILRFQFRDDFDPIPASTSAVPAPGGLALLLSGMLSLAFASPRLRRNELSVRAPQTSIAPA